jgi:hypothetical protein
MERAKAFRFLRITASAVCLLLCGLFVVLWVRSYFYGGDYLYWNIVKHRSVVIGSTHGWFVAYTELFRIDPSRGFRFGLVDEGSRGSFYLAIGWTDVVPLLSSFSYSPIRAAGFHALVISHWLLVLVTGTLAAVFGICRPYRLSFSLRTMFIATTLIAVLLGLIVLAK